MKTKKHFTIALALLIYNLSVIIYNPLTAQNIGINGTGASADPSALLDIDAVATPSLGILIPRIALQAVNIASPVNSPATSLLVYNTASASTGTNAVSPGYYYWDGALWVSNTGNDWKTLGNAATTASVNFLGTTDANDLVFRTNNVERAKFFSNGLFANTSINALGSDGQGISVSSIAWESNNSGYVQSAYNKSALTTANGLMVKIAGTNSLNTIFDVSTGSQTTTGTPVLVAKGNGRIGIGTAIPSALLHIDDGVPSSTPSLYSFKSFLGIINTWGAFIGGNDASVGPTGVHFVQKDNISLTSQGSFLVNAIVDNVTKFAIKGNGFVGIGVTNPQFKLTNSNTGNIFDQGPFGLAGGGAFVWEQQDNVNGYTAAFYNSRNVALSNGLLIRIENTANTTRIFTFNSGGYDRLIALGNGNVGIATPSPLGLLELGLDQGRKPGTSAWTVVSDERLKTIEGNYKKGLAEVLKLNTIIYHYKNAGERKFDDQVIKTAQVGFSAQEVQKIFPEAVGVDADGYLNFNMHSILVAYTNAIKELDAKNKENEKINNEFKLRLEKLENLMRKNK